MVKCREATVYVREMDIFLTMKVLEDTPAVPPPGKLCDEHGYSYEWINGHNHISLKIVFEYSVILKTSYQSWFLVYQRFFLKLVYFNTHDTFKGNWSFRSPSSNRVKRKCGKTITGRPVFRDGSPSSNRVKWECGQTSTERPVFFWNTRRFVAWTNQNPKTK